MIYITLISLLQSLSLFSSMANCPCPYRWVWPGLPWSQWWENWRRGECRVPLRYWSWTEPPRGPGPAVGPVDPVSSLICCPILCRWSQMPGSYTVATSLLQKMHQHLLKRKGKRKLKSEKLDSGTTNNLNPGQLLVLERLLRQFTEDTLKLQEGDQTGCTSRQMDVISLTQIHQKKKKKRIMQRCGDL